MNKPIVAFVDSYTEGFGAEPEESYPARLEAAIGIPVRNEGWRGETTEDGLARLDQSVLAHDPRLVIVEYGANDDYQGRPLADCVADLTAIVEATRARGIPVVLVAPAMPRYGPAFENELLALSARLHCEVVLDVLAGVLEDPTLVSDPFHPNGRGYAIMASRIEPAVRRALTPP